MTTRTVSTFYSSSSTTMRLSRLLLLAPVSLVAAQHAQVFFYPTPPTVGRPVIGHAAPATPTLTSGQAQAVIQHHLGDALADAETPQDHSLWGHFVGWWNGEVGKRPRIVIVQGVDVQHVLPPNLDQPAFYLPVEESWILDPYISSAKEAVDKVLHMPIVKTILDTFDLAVSRAGEALSHELTALVALSDSLWSSAKTSWDAVAVKLNEVSEGSTLWQEATKSVKAGLESMTQPDSAPIVLVIMPGAQNGRHYKRQIETAAKKNSAKDYSASFNILAGTTILLVIVVIASISLLFSIGETDLPSSLTLAIGKPPH